MLCTQIVVVGAILYITYKLAAPTIGNAPHKIAENHIQNTQSLLTFSSSIFSSLRWQGLPSGQLKSRPEDIANRLPTL